MGGQRFEKRFRWMRKMCHNCCLEDEPLVFCGCEKRLCCQCFLLDTHFECMSNFITVNWLKLVDLPRRSRSSLDNKEIQEAPQSPPSHEEIQENAPLNLLPNEPHL